MNIPYLILNFIEFIIILPIILTLFVKYLAERKGWDSPYDKTYSFVSIWSIFYFTLTLIFIALPDYFQINDFGTFHLIANILILIAEAVFVTFSIKIIYKKEIRDSFLFTLILVVFKIIIIFCVGMLLSPLGMVIQDL